MPDTLQKTQRDDLSDGGPPLASAPALYLVIEGERPLSGGLRASLAAISEVRFGRGTTRSFSVGSDGVAVFEIPDPRMSTKHARLVREDDGWLLEDLGSTNGTFKDGVRVTSAELDDESVVTLGATALLFFGADPAPASAPPVVDAPSLKSRPRGTATLVPTVDVELPRFVRVAMSKLSVLLLGESGAGKEVLARTVHQLSARSGPFVAINCGALSPTLVESQLFGHVRGAFSGALRDEPGLVRSASGGTLFLDEVGELPPAAQATLLRVLQEREVLPVGGTKAVPVDVRIIAATLKPIDEASSFRPDLYARLAAFVHRIPPMRDRRGDLGLIVADLLPRIAAERAPRLRLAPDFVTALAMHAWPLNVREIEHVLSVATVTANEDLLRLEHTGEALRGARSRAPKPAPDSTDATRASTRPRVLSDDDQRLKAEVVAALTAARGNVSEVSRAMGKTRMQIHRWMKRFDLDPETFRSGA